MNNTFVTILCYAGFACLAAFFAYLSVRRPRIKRIRYADGMIRSSSMIRLPYLVLSALVFVLPSVFTTLGTDRATYAYIFENVTASQILQIQEQEPLFVFINFILHAVWPDPHFMFFVMYGWMYANLYYVLYRMRDRISLPLAVLFFGLLFAPQSLNLLRIYLAGTILLVASYEMLRNKYLKCVLLWLVAVLIHYSAILFLAAIVATWVFGKFQDRVTVKTVLATAVFAVLFVASIEILPLVKDWSVISRYQHYFDNIVMSDIGLMQFLLYVPVILLGLWYQRGRRGDAIDNVYTGNLLSAFLFAMYGYFISIIGRSSALFMFPFVIYLPMIFRSVRVGDCGLTTLPRKKARLRDRRVAEVLLLAGIVAYIFARYVIYIVQYIELDQIGIL